MRVIEVQTPTLQKRSDLHYIHHFTFQLNPPFCNVLFEESQHISFKSQPSQVYLLRIDKEMADIISGDDITELMEAFARFDTDNDGLINTIELRRVLHYLGQNPTDAELQELAYAMDTDESGKIDLPEFLHMMAKRYLLTVVISLICKRCNGEK